MEEIVCIEVEGDAGFSSSDDSEKPRVVRSLSVSALSADLSVSPPSNMWKGGHGCFCPVCNI